MLVDLTPKGLTGKAAEAALGRANITCNKNGIPFDPWTPMVTSGIRLGSPAATSRGSGRRNSPRSATSSSRRWTAWRRTANRGSLAVEAQAASRRRRTDAAVPDLLGLGGQHTGRVL